MASRPQLGKSQRTRLRIAETAHALFERHGFDAVTMEQIAIEADVVRGTLYNHFPVKEAVLVEWMHLRLAEDLAPLIGQVMTQRSFSARISTLLDASALWWEQHRQYAAAYLRFRFQQLKQGEAGQTSSDMAAAYAALIAKAEEVDEVRVDESAIRLANYLHFLILYALMTWLESPTASLRDELAHAFEFFMLGAKPR